MAGMLEKVAPLSYEAWLDYDVCGTRMSHMELEALRRLVRVAGDGLVSEGGSVDSAALGELGLSGREARELLGKLGPKERPSFTLDVSRGLPGEHFQDRFARAVPSGDRLPEP